MVSLHKTLIDLGYTTQKVHSVAIGTIQEYYKSLQTKGENPVITIPSIEVSEVVERPSIDKVVFYIKPNSK